MRGMCFDASGALAAVLLPPSVSVCARSRRAANLVRDAWDARQMLHHTLLSLAEAVVGRFDFYHPECGFAVENQVWSSIESKACNRRCDLADQLCANAHLHILKDGGREPCTHMRLAVRRLDGFCVRQKDCGP